MTSRSPPHSIIGPQVENDPKRSAATDVTPIIPHPLKATKEKANE